MIQKKSTALLLIFLSQILVSSCSQKSSEKISYSEWASFYNSGLGEFAKEKMGQGMQRVIKETYKNENSKTIKCQVIVTEKETVLGMRGNLVQTFRERTFEQTPKEKCSGIKPSDAPYNNESPKYEEKRIYSTRLGFLGKMRPYQKTSLFKNGPVVQENNYIRRSKGLTFESKFFHKGKIFMHRKEELNLSPEWEIKSFLKSDGENAQLEIAKTWNETYKFVSKQEILKLLKKRVKRGKYMVDRYTAY